MFTITDNEDEARAIPNMQEGPFQSRRENPTSIGFYVAYRFLDPDGIRFLSVPQRQDSEKLNGRPDSLRLALYLYIETIGYGK